MSADDQAFLDILSSVPNDVKRYSNDVAEYIESQADRAASALKSAIIAIPWLPASAKPSPPSRCPTQSTFVPPSAIQRIQSWVHSHKLLTGIVCISLGASTILFFSKRKLYRRRRAKRASNGARLEVVVLAGPPADPITRSIALDLEKRGYIVYVVCSSIEDEIQVQSESRADIKPLMIDLTDPARAQMSIENFAAQIQSPHYAFQGARAHYLSLKSLILLPSINYPSAPVATISPSVFSDLLNTRLLQPVLLLQAFLPLLTSPPNRQHHEVSKKPSNPRVLILTPTIIPSLNPAFHAPESSIVAALDALSQSLRSELSSLLIPVVQLKLGTFDCTTFGAKAQHQLQAIQSQCAETLTWPESARQAYASNYIAQANHGMTSVKGCGQSGVSKGSSLRQLHYAVFDAMDASSSARVIRVGRGSRLYGIIGAWVPNGLVGWMMGLRKVEHIPDDSEALSVSDADFVAVNRYRDAEKPFYD